MITHTLLEKRKNTNGFTSCSNNHVYACILFTLLNNHKTIALDQIRTANIMA